MSRYHGSISGSYVAPTYMTDHEQMIGDDGTPRAIRCGHEISSRELAWCKRQKKKGGSGIMTLCKRCRLRWEESRAMAWSALAYIGVEPALQGHCYTRWDGRSVDVALEGIAQLLFHFWPEADPSTLEGSKRRTEERTRQMNAVRHFVKQLEPMSSNEVWRRRAEIRGVLGIWRTA